MPVHVTTPASISRILFATDLSAHSECARLHAVAEARRHRAKLFVAHVLPREPRLSVSFDVAPGVYDEDRHEAEVMFRRMENARDLDDVDHEYLLPTGELWPALAETIRKRGIQMVVLGTRGRGGVTKLVLGSAAEDVFRKAACPVMTVGPHADPPRPCARCIVCPTDFSSDSESALAHAVARACAPDGRLIMVHALHAEMISSDTPRETLLQRATERLRAWLPQDTGLAEPETVVDFGAAADLVLKTAAQRKAELIIMGVHPPGRLRESPRLPWSTAHKVVCHAHCPVLTVRA